MVKDTKMKVRIFFEVMGWPAEGLTKHLKDVVSRLKKTWKISKEEYAEPIPVDSPDEEQKQAPAEARIKKVDREYIQNIEEQMGSNADNKQKAHTLLTAHAEFEAVVPSFGDLALFSMLYGPSVVEIIEPSEVYLTAGEIQDFLADMISKIQLMDRDVKLLSAQNKIFKDKLIELMPKHVHKEDSSDINI
jgi:hypothetical protein